MRPLNIIFICAIILLGTYFVHNLPNEEEKLILEYKKLIDVVQDEKVVSEDSLKIKELEVEQEKKSIKKYDNILDCYVGQMQRIIDGDNIEEDFCENLEYEKRLNSNGLAQEIPDLTGSKVIDRMNDMLIKYDRHEDVLKNRWERVGYKYNIKPSVLVCIAKADSSLGRQLKSENNFGNVGNNDRGDTVNYSSAIEGISAIGRVLGNKYLGHKQSIGSLSVGGGGTAPFYATSPENWNNNVLNCLSEIHIGVTVDENFGIRIM